MRSRLLLLLFLIVAGLLVTAHTIGGRPRVVYQSTGRIIAIDADDRGLAWLEASQGEAPTTGRVVVLDRANRSGKCVYPDDRACGVALAGDRLLILETDGQTGALLSVPRNGGQPTTLADGLLRPGSIAAAGSSAYWTETKPAAREHVFHIPPLASRTVIRTCSAAAPGELASVAAIEAETDTFRGRLLGLHAERLYWLDISGTTTGSGQGWSAIRSAPATGGPAETAIRERGPQTAMLAGSLLYWTAPSQDAGNPLQYSCVHRTSLPQPSPVTLTDWLTPGGGLCRFRGKVYYTTLGGIWAVPASLDPPRPVKPKSVSRRLAVGWAGALYEVVGTQEGGDALLRRPVTLGARLKAAARLP